MNTIPTIFNERKIPHRVVGGATRADDLDVPRFTVLLLNRGGRYYRSAVFQSLETAGFSSIISVELSSEPYDIENLSIRFPAVKFLVPLEKVSVGDMINLGVAESSSPWVFVVWNDVKIPPSGIHARLVSRLEQERPLCVAPNLSGTRLDQLPVQMVPAYNRGLFQIEPMPCLKDGSPTAYPFDFIGIYDREKFMRLGGYDYTIANPYWQNLDFGIRARLWGERVSIASGFRLVYDGDVPSEDITADASYVRFFLKNLAPVFRRDEAFLPTSKFFSFVGKSGMNLFDAIRFFSGVRAWVRLNRFRFVADAATVTSGWEPDAP